MILIYSKDVDDFINIVIDFLNVKFIRINESNLVQVEQISFENTSENFRVKTDYCDEINFQDINAIWFNGGGIRGVGSLYERKCFEVLFDSYLLQKRVYKLGSRYSDFKINRLDVMLEAKKQGLKIPATLIVDSKAKLSEFYNSFKDKNGIICKRILDDFFYEDENYEYNFNLTFEITEEILNKLPDNFALSFFQERIISEFEIRVINIDGELFSASIHDYNNYVDCRSGFRDMKNLRIIPFKLPNTIKHKLLKLFDFFNLNYGSIDLIFSAGEFYFLELNPTGQISFINNKCNYYLEKIIAKKLEVNYETSS